MNEPCTGASGEVVPAGLVDSGLACPRCEYNLTGLTGERCPECGAAIDWPVVRRERDERLRATGPPWGRWRWRWAPVAFVITALQAALAPWWFARRLPDRPRLRPAAGFMLACVAVAAAGIVLRGHGDAENMLVAWGIGLGAHAVLQVSLFGLLLPPRRGGRFRFWAAVTAYTSYPLVIEGAGGGPPFILHEMSNVWPFAMWGGSGWGNDADAVTTLTFHLWWLGLIAMAWVRLAPRRRWRILLIVLGIPLLTYASSYTGCYLSDALVRDGGW